jgi:hypothetical protein
METEVLDVKSVPAISELKILSVNSAAKIMGIDKGEILHAMEVYVQSGGRDGLAYMERGMRKAIRAGAIKAYLMNQEKKVLYA